MRNSLLLALLLITCSLLGAMVTIMAIKPEPTPCEYQFIVTDDSVTVFDSGRTVGTVKLEGQLDSLITFDNQ